MITQFSTINGHIYLQLVCPLGLNDVLERLEAARLRYLRGRGAAAIAEVGVAMSIRRRVTIHGAVKLQVVEESRPLSHRVSVAAARRGLVHHPAIDRRATGRSAARSSGGVSSCEDR